MKTEEQLLQPTTKNIGNRIYCDILEKRGTLLNVVTRNITGTEYLFGLVRWDDIASKVLISIEELEMIVDEDSCQKNATAAQTVANQVPSTSREEEKGSEIYEIQDHYSLNARLVELLEENQRLKQEIDALRRQNSRPVKALPSVEWYTPPEYIEMVRQVFGGQINTDPASNDFAQGWIQAERYFTKDTGGLINAHQWEGFVFCNPPYGRSVQKWLNAALALYANGQIKGAILLLNRTGATWYRQQIKAVRAICEVNKRIAFLDENGIKQLSPRYYNDFLCVGSDCLVEKFLEVFSGIGDTRLVDQQVSIDNGGQTKQLSFLGM